MYYGLKIKNVWGGGNMNKVLCTMILLCPLAMACAKSQQVETQIAENKNNITEVEHRMNNLEQRVDVIDGNVQAANTRVYDVRNKAGRPTGWTAHPKVEPKPAPTASTQAGVVPQVAHVSPISNPKGAPVTPVAAAPAPVTPVTAAPVAAVTPAPAASTQPKAITRAPLGALDPSSRMGGVEIKKNEPNPSPALSLPPESAMYPPAKEVASAPIVPPVNTNAQAAMPPSSTQQAVVQPIAASPQAVQPVATAKPAKAMSGEQATYKEALDLVLGGKYAIGRDKFNAFLQQYPNGRLAPNAYYWIGESFYAQKNYSEALLAFKQVTSAYPKHHKTPDALLKAGMTYDRLGDKENASLQYKALVADFPSSNAAKIARNKKF